MSATEIKKEVDAIVKEHTGRKPIWTEGTYEVFKNSVAAMCWADTIETEKYSISLAQPSPVYKGDTLIAVYDYIVKESTPELTDEAIDDVITTAFEGGSNYWIDKALVVGDWKGAEYASEVVSKGGELRIHVSETDGQVETLTREKMVKGFELYESKNGKPFDVEFCETDAMDADEVLQLALFGEVVFG